MSIALAIGVIAASSALAVALMLLFRARFAPPGGHFRNTDRLGAAFGFVGAGFAILLGFVVLLSFQRYWDAKSSAYGIGCGRCVGMSPNSRLSTRDRSSGPRLSVKRHSDRARAPPASPTTSASPIASDRQRRRRGAIGVLGPLIARHRAALWARIPSRWALSQGRSTRAAAPAMLIAAVAQVRAGPRLRHSSAYVAAMNRSAR